MVRGSPDFRNQTDRPQDESSRQIQNVASSSASNMIGAGSSSGHQSPTVPDDERWYLTLESYVFENDSPTDPDAEVYVGIATRDSDNNNLTEIYLQVPGTYPIPVDLPVPPGGHIMAWQYNNTDASVTIRGGHTWRVEKL